MRLPPCDDYDPACGCDPSPECLQVGKWFRWTPKSESVYDFPGTDCNLGHGYRIFSSQPDDGSGPNRLIKKMFDVNWWGNIVVMKTGRRYFGVALNITAPEICLISALLERCVNAIQFYVRSNGVHEQVAAIEDSDLQAQLARRTAKARCANEHVLICQGVRILS